MIAPIDVGYLGVDGAANAFLVDGPSGRVLVECGPAACVPRLIRGLRDLGTDLSGIGDLLLTHIHLDHAGAAGHLAAAGARVHVHPFGRPHLVDPSKLIASSRRVHGNAYDLHYGDLLPIPEAFVHAIDDGARVHAAGLRWEALHTPGHARHHVVWLLRVDSACHAFMGDLAGILVPESGFIAVPTPPPEFDPDAWIASLRRVRACEPTHLWLTHGGCVGGTRESAARFLDQEIHRVQETAAWLREAMPMTDADVVRAGLARERELALVAGVRPNRMEQFIDEAFIRMNLGGARRAFTPRA
jgi:glyoxylase-like metal-dependent hydrolase (beta-lactamase superfamily II)